MTAEPLDLERFVLEDEQIDQIIEGSVWATEIHASSRRPRILAPAGQPRRSMLLLLDVDGRDDAAHVLQWLHEPGSDYTARFRRVDRDDRCIFTIRLAAADGTAITVAGPLTRCIDRAFRRSDTLHLAPKSAPPATIDITRATCIANDTEFWHHTKPRRRA